jgi:hypothetical protein
MRIKRNVDHRTMNGFAVKKEIEEGLVVAAVAVAVIVDAIGIAITRAIETRANIVAAGTKAAREVAARR